MGVLVGGCNILESAYIFPDHFFATIDEFTGVILVIIEMYALVNQVEILMPSEVVFSL